MSVQSATFMSSARSAEGRTTPYAYFVGVVLAVVYTFNFLDRQIMAILAEPIRKELRLSDTQLGVLTGLAFVVFYTTFGIVVAWLADRTKRIWIIAAACAIWSVFCAACGLAQNFAQLAAARIGVGVGEAGGSPPSYSLISDYFRPEDRGKGQALYSLGVPVGSMVGAGIGGALAARYGWRFAFFAVGLPGIALAIAALVVVREPKRGGLDPLAHGQDAHEQSPPFLEAVAAFFANRTLVLTAISSGLSAFVGYAGLNWNAAFLMRVKGMTLSQVALYYSLTLGIAGVIGTFGSGWLVDRLGRGDRRWYAWVPAIGFAISLPFFIGYVWAPTWPMAIGFLVVPLLMNNMYLAPAITVIQNAVPPGRRTVSSALLLFILNLTGLGGGPVYVGMISDAMKPTYGTRSLAVGLAWVVPVILLTIAAHLVASVSIARDKRLAAALG